MNEWILGGVSQFRLMLKAINYWPMPNSFDLLPIYIDFLIVPRLMCDSRHYFTSVDTIVFTKTFDRAAGFEPCSAQLSHVSESNALANFAILAHATSIVLLICWRLQLRVSNEFLICWENIRIMPVEFFCVDESSVDESAWTSCPIGHLASTKRGQLQKSG